MKLTAFFHLKSLLSDIFRICVCTCEMLSNMSIKVPETVILPCLTFPGSYPSKCSGDDISDKVILHQCCTRQLSPMC